MVSLLPHAPLPLPVPLSFSLVSLDAGMAVNVRRDHFAQWGSMVLAAKCVCFVRSPALVHIACINWISWVHEPHLMTRLSCRFAPGSGPWLEPGEEWRFLLLFIVGPLNQQLWKDPGCTSVTLYEPLAKR